MALDTETLDTLINDRRLQAEHGKQFRPENHLPLEVLSAFDDQDFQYCMNALSDAEKTAITSVSLSFTQVGLGALQSMLALPQLKSLTLNYLRYPLENKAMLALCDLRSLESLMLCATEFSEDYLAYFTQLEQLAYLNLAMEPSNTSSAQLGILPEIPSLKVLDVSYRQLSADARAALSTLPSLQHLTMTACELIHEDENENPLTFLKALKGLTVLNLSRAKGFDDTTLLESLQENLQLKELNLEPYPPSSDNNPRLTR